MPAAALFSAQDRHVVVMLSGGRDSVCLLDVAVTELGGDRVTALHVNHGLRAAAPADERACAEECARRGVAFESVHLVAAPAAGNLQAWARGERYAAAAGVARHLGAVVATGHTASDQAETVLYRLAASPGRRALLGMRPRVALPAPDDDVTLVRPLLCYTREMTAEHCSSRGLRWREDETNDSPRYARGRVRHGLLPALRAVHPAAEQNVLRTAELLRDESDALEELVGSAIDGDSIELARLRALRPALRRLVLRRLAEAAAGGEPVPEAGRRAEEIAAMSDRGTVCLDLPRGVRAVAEYGALRFTRAEAGPPAALPAVGLTVPGRAAFGHWTVTCGPSASGREDGVVDRDALGEQPHIRAWRPGDRMAPVGLGGTKTLGDLFTARRVPLARRAALPVVVARGEIAWVPGVATGQPFAVRDDTIAAVRLRAHENV